jgi:hypothetical protein
MVKKMLLSVTMIVVFCAGVVSARQLRTPAKALAACHGTCSLTVTCFGECFCYKGLCVSELPPQERSNKR